MTLPPIGLGTWRTFDVGSTEAERAPLERVLTSFVELGGRVVDLSPMYGHAEEVFGELAARLDFQSRLFIATKVWTIGRAPGVRQMEQSMRRLRVAQIDLMQVHNLVDAATHLDTLRGWKNEGRVRFVGLTHYTAAGAEAIAQILVQHAVDAVQINYSVTERGAERRLLPLARDRGIAVLVNRPFATGDLFPRLRSRPLPSWAAEIDCHSWAQLMLKFVVSHPAITCAIPATSSEHHLRDNMAAASGRMPDASLRERIAAEFA